MLFKFEIFSIFYDALVSLAQFKTIRKYQMIFK